MAKIPTPGSPEEADAARARLNRYRANRAFDTPDDARARQVSMPDPVKLKATEDDERIYRGNLNEEPAPVKAKAKPTVVTAARGPKATTAVVVTKPKPTADPNAELRADLLANKRADDAARAAAERKRKEAEAFSANLKSTTKKGGNKTGYAAYQSLMGE